MTPPELVNDLVEVAARVAKDARRAGADAAEVLVRDGAELTAKVRLGEPELVKEAGSRALGLRVFVDRRAAATYTSDFNAASLMSFVTDTVALARLAEPDELNTLPDEEPFAAQVPDLDLWDEAARGIDAGRALAIAKRGEAAALAFDPRIDNSDGATFSRTIGHVAFANSGGFAGGYRGTSYAFYVEPICSDEGGKKRNGLWWTSARFFAALEDAEEVGREAARRTLAKLGARKIDSCEVPVVFDPEAGRGLVGELVGVANGAAFYRRASYLVGREGQTIASPLVTIVDDPLIPRGPGSRPFDGDGLAARKNVVVEAGRLSTVLCDTYSARRLARRSTGSGGRGIGGAPSPTTSNLFLCAGTTPAKDLVRSTQRGLYVTDMMGFGFNPVTGDFSRGASGFWIEGGELAFPVSEVTISASFDRLWSGVDGVGDDLRQRSSTACPTFRVAGMTIAGK